VIDGVVPPLLQAKAPVALVDKVELPQLFATVTTGADGATFGDAIPEPDPLIHPLIVWVTV
jgi:hypothetical protein